MTTLYPTTPFGRRKIAPHEPAGARAIFSDPAASCWLQAAVADLLARDPCDALADAEALAYVMRSRLKARQAAYASIEKRATWGDLDGRHDEAIYS